MTTLQPAARRASPLPVSGAGVRERIHTVRRTPHLSLIAAALLAVAALGIFQVLQTSHVASLGYELRALERERAALAAEVRISEAQVAERSNLDYVYREAMGRLGMVTPAEQAGSIQVAAPAPPDFALPRRYLPQVQAQPQAPVEEPQARAAWWERLLAVLPGFE